MKQNILFIALIIYTLSSCKNNEPSLELVSDVDTTDLIVEESVDILLEHKRLMEVLKPYEMPMQHYQISSARSTIINGKQGTIIHLNPKNLETISGKPLGKTIDIELIELLNQEQLLRSNTQTMSNGELLVSGGAYYLNMTSEGEQLRVKENKNIPIEFPQIAEEEMLLFYGERDSLEQMNWLVDPQKFKSKPIVQEEVVERPLEGVRTVRRVDAIEEVNRMSFVRGRSISPEEMDSILKTFNWNIEEDQEDIPQLTEAELREQETKQKVYQAININQFGWINCDRFYKNPN